MNAAQNKTGRVLSVDILRGLTILVMVFVNDIAGVKNLPWWTYHIPPGVQGITYVDVVFPAFLFIVGMAVPLAFRKRLARGDSPLKLMVHVVIRSLSLVAIGLLIMNGRNVDPETTGVSYAFWNVAMFVGVILFWNIYPKSEGTKAIIFKVLKWSGLVILIVLLAIYRRKDGEDIVWINPYNWAILGGIGWAYLSVSFIYLVTKGWFWWLVLAFGLLVLLNVGVKAGAVDFVRQIPRYIWPIGSGSLASITMAGVILSKIFLEDKLVSTLKDRLIWGTGFAVLLFFVGWLLLPFGLAKIGSTPSWCLLSSGYVVVLFILIYFMVDIKGIYKWAGFIKPAGSNPLLTYLLPDVYYAMFGLYHFAGIAGDGWPGVIRSLLFTLFILGVSALMTQYRIRLQL